ncbi:MAG: hypothetical protein WA746_23980 [Isosphaeraceae bacterium]
MKPVQTLRKAFDRINASGVEAARPKVRRAPACEMLEGRQLLNAAWTPPHGFAGWDGAAGKGADRAAHVYMLEAKGAGHDFAFPGGPVNPGVNPGGPLSLAFPGAPGGVAPSGVAGKSFKAPSAQLQTDFQTLKADEGALMSQIPASLTAAVQADRTVIQKAFSSLTSTQLKALRPSGSPSGTTSSNPTANMTATLTAAGVSSSEINTITTDLQNLKNAYTTTDPTLQVKIAADKAAIVKDSGPSLPTNSQGIGRPGML